MNVCDVQGRKLAQDVAEGTQAQTVCTPCFGCSRRGCKDDLPAVRKMWPAVNEAALCMYQPSQP